jgi:hypothetical protein
MIQFFKQVPMVAGLIVGMAFASVAIGTLAGLAAGTAMLWVVSL